MLHIANVSKRYGSFTAVDGLDLDVEAGQIHGFLGPNGAGKTTTMKMICGLVRPSAGRITVDGILSRVRLPASAVALGDVVWPGTELPGFDGTLSATGVAGLGSGGITLRPGQCTTLRLDAAKSAQTAVPPSSMAIQGPPPQTTPKPT